MDPTKQDTEVSLQRSSLESQEHKITQTLKPEVVEMMMQTTVMG
jgi:hypothetical protein